MSVGQFGCSHFHLSVAGRTTRAAGRLTAIPSGESGVHLVAASPVKPTATSCLAEL